MKILFLFFATLNLAFYTWQADIFGLRGGGQPTLSTLNNPHVTQLLLVSEANQKKIKESVKNEDKAKSSSATTDSKDDKPAQVALQTTTNAPRFFDEESRANRERVIKQNQVCYTLGPFEGIAQAKPISEKLQDLGAFTFERLHSKQVPSGYWVYIPQFDSWKNAREKVMDLEQKGIKDLFILGRGDMKNAISLGLFKNEKGAQERIDKLKKLGEKPKIETQYSEEEKYWIDIDVDAEEKQVLKSIRDIAKTLTVFELNDRKCE